MRDAGGADYALSVAVDTGIVPGPRLFVAGQALAVIAITGLERAGLRAIPA